MGQARIKREKAAAAREVERLEGFFGAGCDSCTWIDRFHGGHDRRGAAHAHEADNPGHTARFFTTDEPAAPAPDPDPDDSDPHDASVRALVAVMRAKRRSDDARSALDSSAAEALRCGSSWSDVAAAAGMSRAGLRSRLDSFGLVYV